MNYQPLSSEDLEKMTLSEMARQYNSLAPLFNKETITKFSDKKSGLRRLKQLYIELEKAQPVSVKNVKTRKKRQKVFMYPPADEGIKNVAPNSLRGRARDLLVNGATFAQIEQLIREYDVEKGKTSNRISERAYGLIRLLHTYVGYGLREEGQGDGKLIYIVTLDQWNKRNSQPEVVNVTKSQPHKVKLSEDAEAAIKDGWI